MQMKGKQLERVLPFLLAVVLPWVLVSKFYPEEPTKVTTGPEESTITTLPQEYSVGVKTEEGIVQMELEDYILGVVLGEMPASFETEALKAQAVVARTFTLRTCQIGKKHTGGAICTDYSCCQAYCSADTYTGGPEALEKVKKAVEDTSGMVLTYEGALIDATYFSCSGGRTEDAKAVWGADVAYLQAVDSPGEEAATHFTDTVRFSRQAFCEALGYWPESPPEEWFGAVTYTSGGGVASMQIGERTYTGMELRSLLGLKSTAMMMTAVADTVTVTTKGFGHRVGMSQYGADAMAVRGSSYEQILAHYYPGTKLIWLFDKEGII